MKRQYGLDAELKIYSASLQGQSRWPWPVSLEGWRNAAKGALDVGPWGYLEGSAGLEATTRANRLAFDRYAVRSRMLRNVEDRDLSVNIPGASLPVPIVVAPIGVQSIIHAGAEGDGAEAAAASGIPFIASTVSSLTMEEIARRMGDGARWFQLYPGRDRDIMASFIHRAEASGYSAIVVTTDTSMLGWRTMDLQNVYLPFLRGEGIANFTSDAVFRRRLQQSADSNPQAVVQEFLAVYVNPAFTWDDLAWVRSLTQLPLWVKGINHPDDAQRAQDVGVDGVIVSNHGGRQVDGGIASLDALVEIRAHMSAAFSLILDSGVRCAADIMKALALGASAVTIGRPYAYALAVGGRAGVEELLSQWKGELDLQMGLSGYRTIAELGPDTVTKVSG